MKRNLFEFRIFTCTIKDIILDKRAMYLFLCKQYMQVYCKIMRQLHFYKRKRIERCLNVYFCAKSSTE